MPRVPLLNPGGDVSPRPLPTPEASPAASPEAFGAGIGQAVQQGGALIGEQAHGLAVEAKQKADRAKAFKAETDLMNGWNALIFDPKEGFVTKRGTDAMAAYEPTVRSMKDARDKQLATLANPEQQQMFLERSQAAMDSLLRHVQGHTHAQVEQANSDAFKAREATSLATLANMAFDPTGRSAEMDQMRAAIVEQARTAGAKADTLKAMLQDYDQKAHATVLDQMLAKQQGAAAQLYFQQVRSSLGVLSDNYEKRVREVGVAQKGDAYARDWTSRFRIPGSQLVDESKLLKAAGDLQEPQEVRDAALQRALHYSNVIKQGQDERNSQVFARALSDLDQTGIVNPNDLSYLKNPGNGAGKYLDTLIQMRRRNAEQEINAPPTVAQEAAFGRAQLAIGADQREFWATQNYDQMAGTFGGQVTRAQLDQLSRDLDQAHKWAQEQQRSDREQAIQVQVKDRLIKNAGFNKDQTKWTDDQWTVFSRALTDVKIQQQAFMAKKDAKPLPDDVKKWIDRPLSRVKVQGSGIFWDDTPVRAQAEALPQFQGKPTVYVIPSNEKKRIDEALQSAKIPLTDENRQAAYRRRHGL